MKSIFALLAAFRSRPTRLGLVLGLAGTMTAPAATYNEEDVVGNFTLFARRAFTNDTGTVLPAGTPVHLTDFAGKIVFMEFFYVW